jgi:uncharacterized protein YndB with AHSA1/START domain
MPSYYRLMTKLGFLAIALLAPAFVRADVADAAANGFTVQVAVTIQAPPQEVYRRLVHNVGDWWNPIHTYSRDAHNLSIDDKPMGCFCEKLPGGGGVRHFEVVNVDPGKRLVLTGGMGPLQSIAATGTMTIQLAPMGDGTKLAVVYTAAGYLPAGMNTWAAPVDSVLTEQFLRLKSFVETGRAENEKAAPK